MAKPILTLEERFSQYVEPEPTSGCFLWAGAIDRMGYGRILVGKVNCLAHRIAWEMAFGSIPRGMFVLHRCDLRVCVSVEHLFLGSNQDNMSDMARKNRGTQRESYGAYKVGPGRYQSRVSFCGKEHSLGVYKTATEASSIATAFKRSLYSRSAQINGATSEAAEA